MIKNKKHIIIRRAKAARRLLKHHSLKKIRRWLRRNLNQHPLVLGFIFLIWVSYFLPQCLYSIWTINKFISFHAFIIFAWLILVAISNLLKDKPSTEWYFRKRFIFSLLILPFVTPLGIALLWLGSKFKNSTKIIFTFIFATLFLVSYIFPAQQYEKLIKKTTFDYIFDMISSPKRAVFIKKIKQDMLTGMKLKRINKKKKIKLAPSQIASLCSSSVVSIKTKDRIGKDIGIASGFIISGDGLILTNFHVVQGAYSAEIKFKDQVLEDCVFIKGIPELDIALIKVNEKKLPALAIGDSDSLTIGEGIVAIGNPWGLERTVSDGVISAIRSKENIKLIQITAPVSMGSSGGPVINTRGEVVGITTLASVFGGQNINFAIPINYIKQLIGQDK